MSETELLDNVVAIYDADPEKFSAAWRKTSGDKVWHPLLPLFHKAPARLVDIGAGDGRDAEYFAREGYDVTAVEPSGGMRALGKRLLGEASAVKWVDDALPDLFTVAASGQPFDMAVAGAVFIHLPAELHAPALRGIARVLRRGGRAAITLRQRADSSNLVFTASSQDFEKLAPLCSFSLVSSLADCPDTVDREMAWDFMMLEKR